MSEQLPGRFIVLDGVEGCGKSTQARLLAEALAGMAGVRIDPAAVETNIVMFEVVRPGLTAEALAGAMDAQGVRFLAMGPQTCRMVTHLDVSRRQVEEAITCLRRFLGHAA